MSKGIIQLINLRRNHCPCVFIYPTFNNSQTKTMLCASVPYVLSIFHGNPNLMFFLVLVFSVPVLTY